MCRYTELRPAFARRSSANRDLGHDQIAEGFAKYVCGTAPVGPKASLFTAAVHCGLSGHKLVRRTD